MVKRTNPIAGKGFLAVAEAGHNNAAESLKQMANGCLDVDILWAGSVPTPRLSEISGHPEDFVIGAYVRVNGEAPGHALMLFSVESAAKLADLVLGYSVGTTTELGEMEQSLLQELGNILTASYLTALGDHYKVTMLPDPPLLAMDMAASMVENVLANSGQFEKETLAIVTRFRGLKEMMDGVFLYIPETVSIAEAEEE
ncbi:MAG: chemotaxis protein CheC [Armatimonadota bacterium]